MKRFNMCMSDTALLQTDSRDRPWSQCDTVTWTGWLLSATAPPPGPSLQAWNQPQRLLTPAQRDTKTPFLLVEM